MNTFFELINLTRPNNIKITYKYTVTYNIILFNMSATVR